MCFSLIIGAAAEASSLAAFFQKELEAQLGLPAAADLRAFPGGDVVRTLTREGCSCRLFERADPLTPGTIWPTFACRSALAMATAVLGDLRVLIRTPQAGRRPRLSRVTVLVEELLGTRVGLPPDVLIEVLLKVPSEQLN